MCGAARKCAKTGALNFVCGSRAERAARQDFLRVRTAAEKLSCAPEELIAAAERALSERDANFKRTRSLLQRLAEIEAGQAVREAAPNSDGLRIVQQAFEDAEPEFLGHFATEIAKTEKSIALLAGASSGNILFAQHPSAAKDMNVLLKQVLEKIGGKGGGTRDFARGRLNDRNERRKRLGTRKGSFVRQPACPLARRQETTRKAVSECGP